MNLQDLMLCINQRSTSFFDAMVKATGGKLSTITFRDIVLTGVGTLKSSFNKELVMMVYLDQGDKQMVGNQLLNMIYAEIPDNEELTRKVIQLKKTALYPTFFKATRRLDDMLHNCAWVAFESAITNKNKSTRTAAALIGCGKDMYITHFQGIVDEVSNNLANRLAESERKIIASIYGNS